MAGRVGKAMARRFIAVLFPPAVAQKHKLGFAISALEQMGCKIHHFKFGRLNRSSLIEDIISDKDARVPSAAILVGDEHREGVRRALCALRMHGVIGFMSEDPEVSHLLFGDDFFDY